jgi:hypothetical protein
MDLKPNKSLGRVGTISCAGEGEYTTDSPRCVDGRGLEEPSKEHYPSQSIYDIMGNSNYV